MSLYLWNREERDSNRDFDKRLQNSPPRWTLQPAGNVATAHSSAGKQSTEEAARALLALASAGDRSAMVKLYVLYFVRLANFSLHLTAHSDVAEELINDIAGQALLRGDLGIEIEISHIHGAYGRHNCGPMAEKRPPTSYSPAVISIAVLRRIQLPCGSFVSL